MHYKVYGYYRQEQISDQIVTLINYLQKDDLQRIHTACEKCIPKEYMPDFVFLPDTEEYYLKGMYWTAMDRKENEK